MPPTWEQHALANVLAGGPHAVLSHGGVARHRGLELFRRHPVEITEPRRCSADLARLRTHHSLVVDPDREIYRGIPCTSAARMIVDLSGRLAPPALGRVTDDAIRLGQLDLQQLIECAERLRSAPGRRMKVVRVVLALRYDQPSVGESAFEDRVYRVLSELAGIPGLVRQFAVTCDGRRYRIDIALPREMIAVEADGWAFHGSRTAFSNDRTRANRLTAAGWTVLRFTPDMTDAEIAAIARATYDRHHSLAS